MGSHEHGEPGESDRGWAWECYEPPADYDRLTGARQLVELCKLKFAVYAPEVERLPDSWLRLFLRAIPSGGPAGRYEREFTLWSSLKSPEFRVEIDTPSWETESGLPRRREFALQAGADPGDGLAASIALDMEAATALPGMPMSRFHFPDWIARGEAHARGRIPDVLIRQ
jgi:hypothetical protein